MPRPGYQWWQPGETAFLKASAGRLTAEEIADRLNRPVASVVQKAHRLNIYLRVPGRAGGARTKAEVTCGSD
jgi:hypothetical protein